MENTTYTATASFLGVEVYPKIPSTADYWDEVANESGDCIKRAAQQVVPRPYGNKVRAAIIGALKSKGYEPKKDETLEKFVERIKAEGLSEADYQALCSGPAREVDFLVVLAEVGQERAALGEKWTKLASDYQAAWAAGRPTADGGVASWERTRAKLRNVLGETFDLDATDTEALARALRDFDKKVTAM